MNNHSTHFKFSSFKLIEEGFHLFAKAPGVFIVYMIIGWALHIVANWIPFLGAIVALLIISLHSVGFYILLNKLHEKGSIKIEDCFEAVNYFGQAALVNILYWIFITIGFLLFLIPGVYLVITYVLALPFLIFDHLKAWDALERSRKVIHKNFLSVFKLLIMLFILNILGVVTLGIGLLITVPTTQAAIYLLYRKLRSSMPPSELALPDTK